MKYFSKHHAMLPWKLTSPSCASECIARRSYPSFSLPRRPSRLHPLPQDRFLWARSCLWHSSPQQQVHQSLQCPLAHLHRQLRQRCHHHHLLLHPRQPRPLLRHRPLQADRSSSLGRVWSWPSWMEVGLHIVLVIASSHLSSYRVLGKHNL